MKLLEKLLKITPKEKSKDYLLIQKTNRGAERNDVSIFIHKSNIEKIRVITKKEPDEFGKIETIEVVQVHLKSGEPIIAQKGSDSIFFVSESDLDADIHSISHI